MAEVNPRIFWNLIWAGCEGGQTGKFCPPYMVSLVHSSANQNENSTGLAPSMKSSHVINHVTLESSVSILFYMHDVRWPYCFRSWCYCFGRWRYCPYKSGEENNGGCSFQVVVNNRLNMFELAERRAKWPKQNYKLLQFQVLVFPSFFSLFLCCMSNTTLLTGVFLLTVLLATFFLVWTGSIYKLFEKLFLMQ